MIAPKVATSAVFLVLALGVCGARAAGGVVSQPRAGGEEAGKPAQAVREERIPVKLVIGFARAQLSIARGDAGAFARQSELAMDVTRKLSEQPVDVWLDRLNRSALIKFVLSGGDPALLRKVASAISELEEPEKQLIEGTLSFASGNWVSTLHILNAVDHVALGAALGGHIALVKAIAAAPNRADEALDLSEQASMLSPGTIVEEAALRLAIELSIRLGDHSRFDAAVVRYLYRYPSSIYGHRIVPRIAAVLGALDYLARDGLKRALDAVTTVLPPERQAGFFTIAAESALRTGKFTTAEAAANRALKVAPAGSVGAHRSLGIAVAAAIARNDVELGRRLLAQAQGATMTDSDAVKLLAAASGLVKAITAPAQRVSESQRSGDLAKGRPVNDKVKAVLERLEERMGATAALLERDGL